MAEKRVKKGARLLEEIDRLEAVRTYGDRSSPVALMAWGSNKGVACEVAGLLGLRVIQPVVLSPFPLRQMKEALSGVKRLVSVEDNMDGQLGLPPCKPWHYRGQTGAEIRWEAVFGR